MWDIGSVGLGRRPRGWITNEIPVHFDKRLDTTVRMTGPTMTPEASWLFRTILLDKELMAVREAYCRTVTGQLSDVAGWLGVDSLIGARDSREVLSVAVECDERQGPDRYDAFRGVSAVVEMAAELGNGSVALLDAGLRYATASLVRQLIEAEYLLSAFDDDIARAKEWYRSSASEIRKGFMPRTMRPLGGFSDREYWTHCDRGGHPSPQGRHLLRYGMYESNLDSEILNASAWGDLAQHLRRVWLATRRLLTAHHDRFATVRIRQIDAVDQAELRWIRLDPFAKSVNLTMLNELALPTEDDSFTEARSEDVSKFDLPDGIADS
jgi:hypothetical protein